MMSNPTTQQKDLLNIIYALTTVKGASVKKALHSLLDGKIMNMVSSGSLDRDPYRSYGYLQDL